MKQAVESLGRIRAQGIALLVVVFAAGALVGAAGDRLLGERPIPRRPFAMRLGEPGHLPPPFERLGLTDEQRQRITAILDAARPLTDSILEETLPRLRAVTDSIRAEIRGVLTEEQRERFDREMPRILPGRPGFGRGGGPGRPPPH
jgi:Spy/CpxP family protein refolding chaperone